DSRAYEMKRRVSLPGDWRKICEARTLPDEQDEREPAQRKDGKCQPDAPLDTAMHARAASVAWHESKRLHCAIKRQQANRRCEQNPDTIDADVNPRNAPPPLKRHAKKQAKQHNGDPHQEKYERGEAAAPGLPNQQQQALNPTD